MGSPFPFLYFLLRKAQQAGRSRASQKYEEAMRSGTPADRLRERARRAVRELLAFWILGFVVIMLCVGEKSPAPMPLPAQDFVFPSWFWGVVLLDSVLFFPTWLLYRLIRFALVIESGPSLLLGARQWATSHPTVVLSLLALLLLPLLIFGLLDLFHPEMFSH